MFHFDIDHTLVRWGSDNADPDMLSLSETSEELQGHRPRALMGLSTARTLEQTRSLSSTLAQVPVDFIAINGGRHLFFNEQGRPSDEFVQGLRLDQADPIWKAQHAGLDWDDDLAERLNEQQLQSWGFERIPNPDPESREQLFRAKGVELRNHPDAPFFKLRNLSSKEADRFIDELETRYMEAGMPCRRICFEWGPDQVRSLEPARLDKTSLLEHLVQRFPGTRYVVTAGDRADDGLEPSAILGRPNLRIVAGEREETQALREAAGVVSVPTGRLAPGIRAHLNGIPSQAFSIRRAW